MITHIAQIENGLHQSGQMLESVFEELSRQRVELSLLGKAFQIYLKDPSKRKILDTLLMQFFSNDEDVLSGKKSGIDGTLFSEPETEN